MIHGAAPLQNGHIQEGEAGPGYKGGLQKYRPGMQGGVREAKAQLELAGTSRARQRSSASA